MAVVVLEVLETCDCLGQLLQRDKLDVAAVAAVAAGHLEQVLTVVLA
jgi:hypothetical protein